MRRIDLIFESALNAFLQDESESLLSGVSERNTCGRLAYYLQLQLHQEELSDYYADVEYNRKQEGKVKTILDDDLHVIPITPDLIVHTRGELLPPNHNLIAIKAKKLSRPIQERIDDKNRLRAMTMPVRAIFPVSRCHPEHVCDYKVRIFLLIDIERRSIESEYFKQGALTKTKVREF